MCDQLYHIVIYTYLAERNFQSAYLPVTLICCQAVTTLFELVAVQFHQFVPDVCKISVTRPEPELGAELATPAVRGNQFIVGVG